MSSSHAQFDAIYHGLETHVGKLRLAAGGLGWKSSSVDRPRTLTLEAERMKSFQWIRVARGYQLRIHLAQPQGGRRRETFDGFSRDDYDRLSSAVSEYFSQSLELVEVSARGWNWGEARIEDSDVRFLVRDKLAFEIPASLVANSNMAGKTEVSMEFIHPEEQQPVANTGAANGAPSTAKAAAARRVKGDQLVEMRLYIPGNIERGGRGGGDDGDDASADDAEEESAAAAFHEAIKAEADIGQVAGDGIVVFKEVLVTTPRGRYDLDMYPNFLRLRGKTYDYKVLYSSITRLFLLPKPDDVHVHFVIGLDPPIRQGQTRYPYLVMQFVREEEMDAELNVDEETLQTRYEGKLKKRYEEPTFKIVTTLFRVLSGQKLVAPTSESFESASNQQPCVKCNIKATDGLLYPLDRQLLWVSKQPVHIPYSDIHQVVFSRVGSAAVASAKTFDLRVVTRSGGGETTFSSLSREEHDALADHFAARKVRVKNEMSEAEGGLGGGGGGGGGVGAAVAMEEDEEDEEMNDDDDDDDEDGGGGGGGGKRARRQGKARASAGKAAGGDAMDDDDSEEDDEDFEASDSGGSGGSPSDSSDDDDDEAGGGAETGSDDMVDAGDKAPKRKKARTKG